MLEDFIPAAAEGLRSTPLGAHLDAFCALLSKRGYCNQTIREKLWTIARLARWMVSTRIALVDLDERVVEQFVSTQRRSSVRTTLLQLLQQLRDNGVLRAHPPIRDGAPGALLVARYAEYLRQERGLATCSVQGYLAIVSPFVDQQLRGGASSPDSLRANDLREFLLNRIRHVVPKRAQYVATALRSFLRFLFLRGEIGSDLALTVPTVRQAHLVSVPRHLPPEDVERLLDACDRSSVTGRRDHAILLLLARLGLRASEVMTLQLGDLRWREGELIVRGKGLIRDRLPLLNDVGKAIALYLEKDRPPGSSRSVFVCRKAPHRGFSHPSTVTTIVVRALARAGLTPVRRGAHLLRHSLATTMVRRGASFAEIGQVLRHRSPNTTEIYAKLDFTALRDVAMPWPASGGAR